MASAWHKWHMSPILIESMGLRLETNVFNALLALFFALFALLLLYKGTIGIIKWPALLWHTFINSHKGDCITQVEELLIRVSNHDYERATSLLEQLDCHSLPPRLKLILANNVAVLSNELPVIKQSFIDLAGCTETRNAGLEGLITVYMQELDWEAGHLCCKQLWESAPSEWLATTHTFILIHAQGWAELSQLLHNDRFRTFCSPEAIAQLSLVALYYEAIVSCEEGEDEKARIALEEGSKQCGYGFMPLNILLAELYIKAKDIAKLEELLQSVWAYHPHDILADLAMQLAEHLSKPRFFTKIMQIVKPQSNAYESLILVARAALACNLYEEAQAALESAVQQKEGLRACLMMAQYHQNTGATISKTMEWLNRATRAGDDRLVLCYYWDTATQQLTMEQSCTSLLIACTSGSPATVP
ncbi:MAG: hypothetical protein JSS50_03225 [Proteobacteria bacterium]|nr:hypothetical protein [Pseudomonadota bacterium]